MYIGVFGCLADSPAIQEVTTGKHGEDHFLHLPQHSKDRLLVRE